MKSFLPRVLALLLLAVTPGFSREGDAFVVVRPVVNLHSAPREDADVVTQALLSERVVEKARQGGWLQVVCEDDYPGWIPATALRLLDPGERYPAAPGRTVAVDALAAHLYQEPDVTRHAPVLTAPFGVRLERVQGGRDTERWIEVRLPDRRTAWVQAGDLRSDLAPLDLEASLALAHRFLGVTYTWGGSSSFGFDCSGFTQTVVRSRGPLLPRDAHLQAAWSGVAPVADRASLQRGDLLFFGKDPAHITHVGLYLGKDQFIHDTPRGRPGVQVSSLQEPAWSRILVAMRRVK